MSFPTYSILSFTAQKKSAPFFFFFLSSFSDLVLTVMEPDWDLHAVVRSCTATSSGATTASTTSSSDFGASVPPSTSHSFFSVYNPAVQGGQVLPPSENPYGVRPSIEELHELCKPFFTKPQPHTFQPSSPLSSFSYSSVPKSPRSHQEQKQPPQPGSASTPKPKRRLICPFSFIL